MTEQKTESKKGLTVVTAQDAGLTSRAEAATAANFSQYIRALLLNWRQGTVSVKGRSDVKYSTKKPWRQKGTGRARAGTARSPLWRGGGVTFGPQSRTRKVSVPRALRKRVLNELFGQLLDKNAVTTLDWTLNSDVPKTALANRMLKEQNLYDSKILLMISNNDILMQRSFSNLPNVRLVLFDQVNAFDLAHAEKVLVFEKDMDSFKEMVARWN